jgi:hypothetical protein
MAPVRLRRAVSVTSTRAPASVIALPAASVLRTTVGSGTAAIAARRARTATAAKSARRGSTTAAAGTSGSARGSAATAIATVTRTTAARSANDGLTSIAATRARPAASRLTGVTAPSRTASITVARTWRCACRIPGSRATAIVVRPGRRGARAVPSGSVAFSPNAATATAARPPSTAVATTAAHQGPSGCRRTGPVTPGQKVRVVPTPAIRESGAARPHRDSSAVIKTAAAKPRTEASSAAPSVSTAATDTAARRGRSGATRDAATPVPTLRAAAAAAILAHRGFPAARPDSASTSQTTSTIAATATPIAGTPTGTPLPAKFSRPPGAPAWPAAATVRRAGTWSAPVRRGTSDAARPASRYCAPTISANRLADASMRGPGEPNARNRVGSDVRFEQTPLSHMPGRRPTRSRCDGPSSARA